MICSSNKTHNGIRMKFFHLFLLHYNNFIWKKYNFGKLQYVPSLKYICPGKKTLKEE